MSIAELDRTLPAASAGQPTEAQRGHQLRTTNGSIATLTAVHNHTGVRQMHDLTITDTHTYYVAAGDVAVLVHNRNRYCDGDENPFSSGKVDGSEERSRNNERIDDLNKNIKQHVDIALKVPPAKQFASIGAPKPPSPYITSAITMATHGDLAGALVITLH